MHTKQPLPMKTFLARFSGGLRVLAATALLGLAWSAYSPIIAQDQDNGHADENRSTIVIDNFEDDPLGDFPEGWACIGSGGKVRS